MSHQYPVGYFSLRKKKIQSVEVTLEHDIDEQYQYSPGEELRGCVVIRLNEPVKVVNIQLQIRGEGSVSWENPVKHTKFAESEVYIDVTETLVRSADGESMALSKGVHEFPFYHQLPFNLPSSFIGRYGSVTYLVRGTLNPDPKYGEQIISSEPFLILRPLDLSMYPEKLTSYECEAKKRYYGICCINGKLSSVLQINRQAFTPGEDIIVSAEISNGSPKLVTALQVGFVMNSTFYAKTEMMTNSQIVSKKRDDYELGIGEGRRWNKVRLSIPPYVPETRLDCSQLIDVSYDLLFQVEVDGGIGINVLLPLIVGTRGLPDNLIPTTNGINKRQSKENPLWRPIEQKPNFVEETQIDPEFYEPLSDKEDSEIGSINMEDFSYGDGDDRFKSKNTGNANNNKQKKRRKAPRPPNQEFENTNL